jgi:hypothetical protein
LQAGDGVAVRDDVEPITVAPILGDTALVGCEQNCASRGSNPLHFDEAQFAGGEVEAGNVVAQIFRGHVVDLATLRLFMLHDDLHRGGFRLEIGLEPSHLGRLSLWVR